MLIKTRFLISIVALAIALMLCCRIFVVEGQDRARFQTIMVPSAPPYFGPAPLAKSGFAYLFGN